MKIVKMPGLMPSAMSASLSLFTCLLFAVFPCAGQSGAKNGEWRTYGGDLGSTRYAALDQINAGNFDKLQVAWRFSTANLGPRVETNLESTPLMVNGVLYSTGGIRRAVVAIDAATGEQLWMHSEREGARGTNAPHQLSGRGLAYWTDGKEERILYVTLGYQLVALDAKTGVPVASFGKNGLVDLKQGDDQTMDIDTADIGLNATPIVASDVVVVGALHSNGNIPKNGKTNVKGYVRGFDVRTGRRLWIFHTIPLPGEFGYDTWEKDSASYTGNTGVWGQISVDEALGLVYLPVELPTSDFYGGHRPGNGLFGESLVALDLKTGVRKWHYQLVHHGIWDMDIPCAPILTDITINGQNVKAVAQPTKQAFLYVFDRVTGKPIWPIEERPVPQGDVPGEWYSPTQPFPTKPRAYDRQGVTIDDLIDFTPELRAAAVDLVSKYKLGPAFTPPVVSKAEGPLATLALGPPNGGTNWPGGSYDPETHILYVFSQTEVAPFGLLPPSGPNPPDINYVQGNAAPAAGGRGGRGGGGRGGLTVQGMPLVKPPYGRISAIDMNEGEILWQIAHGETPDVVRNAPALQGMTIPRTGRVGMIGTLVTKSLLIAGESGFFTAANGQRGALLRAYDKATGKDAGTVMMPAPQTGSPMTYMLNGKQYLVLAIGGTGYPSELVAYKLP
jgi:quinoprotein glucose dehydrogenase